MANYGGAYYGTRKNKGFKPLPVEDVYKVMRKYYKKPQNEAYEAAMRQYITQRQADPTIDNLASLRKGFASINREYAIRRGPEYMSQIRQLRQGYTDAWNEAKINFISKNVSPEKIERLKQDWGTISPKSQQTYKRLDNFIWMRSIPPRLRKQLYAEFRQLHKQEKKQPRKQKQPRKTKKIQVEQEAMSQPRKTKKIQPQQEPVPQKKTRAPRKKTSYTGFRYHNPSGRYYTDPSVIETKFLETHAKEATRAELLKELTKLRKKQIASNKASGKMVQFKGRPTFQYRGEGLLAGY